VNLFILIITSILLVSISIFFDIYSIEESSFWFQRSGSLLVVIGAIFEGKYILRSSQAGQVVLTGTVTIEKEEAKKECGFISSLPDIKTHAGFYIIVIGTVIWGYGDILIKALI